MSDRRYIPSLSIICLLFAGFSICGISWGLPGRDIDKYLFGDGEVWSGEKIYRLAGAAGKFHQGRGADVDADPASASTDGPVLLTGSDEDIAKIYLRYRLYTHQPDEMIAMMALAGMNPGEFDFDPRLYQYGGLFIYPVGALIYAGGLIGLIDVRSDVVYYLDHPEEFGKFYIVARTYAAAWGVVGVLVVFAIGRRLGGTRAGLLAALLFALLPVVICMAHEGKPHLPGAVLMLLAVLFGMRYVAEHAAAHSAGKHRDWWLMCACCGASLGMVLSSWPIFALIPVIAMITNRAAGFSLRGCTNDGAASPGDRPLSCDTVAVEHTTSEGTPSTTEGPRGLKPAARRAGLGIALALVVYVASNPYVVINAVANREVLASNFGNSLAMYRADRIGEGFIRVVELNIEGATLIVAGLGTLALIGAIRRRTGLAVPLVVPAILFFGQFVLIGAGKPAEYGRFGVFPDTALAIGTACILAAGWEERRLWMRRIAIVLVTGLVGWHGLRYLWNFRIDTGHDHSRIRLAGDLSHCEPDADSPGFAIALSADPAPYGCPPINFSKRDVYLVRHADEASARIPGKSFVLMEPVDDPNGLLQASTLNPAGDDPVWASGQSSGSNWPGPTPISWANKSFRILQRPQGSDAAS